MKPVREAGIQADGIQVPLILYADEAKQLYKIEVDGVEWLTIGNRTHAIVLYEMMADHLSEYYNFIPRE